MSMFIGYVLLLTSLLSSVLAIPMVKRDVVDPPVTYPTIGTVWHVGQTQTVTWNATGLPVQQTNPVGRLVLGYWYNNSENLMLDSPLATGLNYSVGQAQITVPNVPTRSDYIVVLFGDSGNASPQFTIINDASSSTSVVPPPLTTTSPGSTPSASSAPSPPGSNPAAPSPPTSAAPPGNLGSSDSSGGSSPELGAGSSTVATPSPTSPTHTSTLVVVTASATPSSTQSSAAWEKHVPSLGTSFSVALAVVLFAFS